MSHDRMKYQLQKQVLNLELKSLKQQLFHIIEYAMLYDKTFLNCSCIQHGCF